MDFCESYWKNLFPEEIVAEIYKRASGIDLYKGNCDIFAEATTEPAEEQQQNDKKKSDNPSKRKPVVVDVTRSEAVHPPDGIRKMMLRGKYNRLDFGATYNVPLSSKVCDYSRIMTSFRFVLDMDIDDIKVKERGVEGGNACKQLNRTCCGTAKKLCRTCWEEYVIPLIRGTRMAIKDLFSQNTRVLFVYSGRKGFGVIIGSPALAACMNSVHRNEIFKIINKTICGYMNTEEGEKEMTSIFDFKPTTQMGHLHKAPFSINPHTGNVARPINENTKFDEVQIKAHQVTREMMDVWIDQIKKDFF